MFRAFRNAVYVLGGTCLVAYAAGSMLVGYYEYVGNLGADSAMRTEINEKGQMVWTSND